MNSFVLIGKLFKEIKFRVASIIGLIWSLDTNRKVKSQRII